MIGFLTFFQFCTTLPLHMGGGGGRNPSRQTYDLNIHIFFPELLRKLEDIERRLMRLTAQSVRRWSDGNPIVDDDDGFLRCCRWFNMPVRHMEKGFVRRNEIIWIFPIGRDKVPVRGGWGGYGCPMHLRWLNRIFPISDGTCCCRYCHQGHVQLFPFWNMHYKASRGFGPRKIGLCFRITSAIEWEIVIHECYYGPNFPNR